MTCCTAKLLNLHENRIGVTVVKHMFEFLHITTLLAFAPKSLTTAAVVTDLSGVERLFVRLFIHVGEHEHFEGFCILCNHRYQWGVPKT